jgi:hypothetical protein
MQSFSPSWIRLGWFLASAPCMLLFLSVVGCGGGPKRPPTYGVRGVITLDGKPLVDAIVTFRPQSNQRPANGRTDSSGTYTLSTFSSGDGAMAGAFAVAITKYNAPSVVAAATEEDGYVPPAGQLPTPKNVLDKKYADITTSGLTATVLTDAENVIDFALPQ